MRVFDGMRVMRVLQVLEGLKLNIKIFIFLLSFFPLVMIYGLSIRYMH